MGKSPGRGSNFEEAKKMNRIEFQVTGGSDFQNRGPMTENAC